MTSKIRPTCSSAAYPPLSKSSIIYRPQQLKKASISAQKLYFRIIIELSSYRLIGLRGNRIYDLFIFERSYEYQIQNVSITVLSFCYHMHFFGFRSISTPN